MSDDVVAVLICHARWPDLLETRRQVAAAEHRLLLDEVREKVLAGV